MLDYGTLPPEINSARMYSGPGAGPMMASAAAWDVLANGLESTSRGYSSAITQLQGESWSGGASEAMAGAAAPYVAWMTNAGLQAEEAATQARAAAAAYETAFAATVPPTLVTANRTQLATLVTTNIFGQNTAMIGATEADYEQMWAQDAAAMYGYAASSSAASRLTQFSQPPQTTNATGQSAQTAAVGQALSTSTAGNSQTTLSQVMSTVPQQLQSLSTAASSSSSTSSSSSSALSSVSDFNTLTAPVNLSDGISRTITSGGGFGTGLFRSNIQAAGDAAKAAAGAAKTASTGSAGLSGPMLASAGNATTVGKLSVPQGWATTNPAAATVAEPHWLSDAELDGGPSWQEAPATNMWNRVPPAGMGTASGLLSRPSVNNALRVSPRQFKMPRPSLGG
ncbi:PPE family protein [Mycobacterium sp.]|uniref:PPE family protein n=1 Tax=Mycobacterium sp. TaxID=1785 RepID=UPI003C7124C7